jgi:SMC interacting uncharacterized protein involved in chromosome segregation
MKEQTGKTVKMAANTEPKSEIDALKEQIQKLQTQLEAQPKTLEERIQYFKVKEDQLKKLSVLDRYADTLATVVNEVDKAGDEDAFYTDSYSLKVTQKQGYSGETELLKVRNPRVIAEVLRYALGSIDTKRQELQTLLSA